MVSCCRLSWLLVYFWVHVNIFLSHRVRVVWWQNLSTLHLKLLHNWCLLSVSVFVLLPCAVTVSSDRAKDNTNKYRYTQVGYTCTMRTGVPNWWQRHTGVSSLHKAIVQWAVVPSQDSNPRPVNHKSDALSIAQPRHHHEHMPSCY